MPQNIGQTRCVLLRHTLPNGDSHLDWMIEVDHGPLVSFRVAIGVNPLADLSFQAERIGDHRREYLDYQGPISGGRGGVVRIATGTVTVIETGADRLELLIDGHTVAGWAENGKIWQFAPGVSG